MNNPWLTDGSGFAARCTRTRRAPTASSRPAKLAAALRAGRLRRARGHGPLGRSDAPSTAASSSLPSAELNCLLPGASRRPRARTRDRGRPRASSEASGATSPRRPTGSSANGGVAYLAHPYWTGVDAGTLELPESVVRDRGLQRRLRARGRARALDRALGRAARGGHACARRSQPTTPITRASTPISRGRGCASASARGRRARGARAGRFYASTGPRMHEVRARAATSVEVRCSPCRTVTLVSGRLERRRGDAGRLGYRHGAAILEATATGASRARGSTVPAAAPARARRDRPTRGAEGVGEPACRVIGRERALEALAARAVRPARDRRRHHRGRDRRARGAGRAARRARRRRRLRRRDVERVVEAHPRRAPLPAARRRPARPRGPPRAARAAREVVAPHLVDRMPFLLPLYRGGPYRPASSRAASSLYSTLARARLGGLVDAASARARACRELRLEGLRVVRASTRRVDERRAGSASRTSRGGATRAPSSSTAPRSSRSARRRAASAAPRSGRTETTVAVEARAVVNAAGPWVDRVRVLEDPTAGTSVRLSKGAHVAAPARARSGRPR